MESTRQKTVTRAVTPPAPTLAPVATKVAQAAQRQSIERVSSPRDPAEKEAEAIAKKILRVPEASAENVGPIGNKGGEKRVDTKAAPSLAPFTASVALMRERGQTPTIARRGDGAPNLTPSTSAEIANAKAGGSPLAPTVRSFMEPRFRADFSGVRVHTGDRAAKLSQSLRAQAFTVGNHIFFGRDQYRPETSEGKELLAHELTHTIQQGASPQARATAQRSEDTTVSEQASPSVQRLGLRDALDYFADAANAIPGYRMFTIILGINPINQSRVERSAANILRAIVEFLPGGNLITRALDAYGVFDRVGTWIEQQLASLGITGASIKAALDRFLDSLSWRDIFDLGGVWRRARSIFSEPIDRIISFLRSLGSAILRFIRDAILRPLAELASRTRAWDLLCAVLGQNPITGEAVPRTAETLIGGFMKLIGQEEVWQNIQRSNATARAWAWFQGAISGLVGFVRQIPSLFLQALQTLTINDLVELPAAFARVAGIFGNFIGQFLTWAGNTVWTLLEIIFEVVAPSVMVYLRRAAGAFRTILRDPMAFVRNLIRAGMQGLRQFMTNFLTHLRSALIGWLTGAMSGANIYIPQALTLREILKFVLSILGLTWQNIRQKLVRAIGETAVATMETTFDIVVTLVRDGPAAAWQKILESLTNLREMVMEAIMNFVAQRIVQAAITRLLSMLDPTGIGALIQVIIAIYNTVMFFIERMRQIAQVVAAFIDSIAAIAAGSIGAAANRVEQTMAGLLTLVISFLARLAGLGRVADAVTNLINRVRQPIDRALDRVVDWIVTQARRLGRFVAQAGVPQDPNERLRLGMRAAIAAVNALSGRRVGQAVIPPVLAAIRVRYGFRTLEPFARAGKWWVRGVVNPIREDVSNKDQSDNTPETTPSTTGTTGTTTRPPELANLATPRLDRLEQQEPGVSVRYVTDWKAYNADGGEQAIVLYVEGRAARKLGRRSEAPALAAYSAKGGAASTRNNRTIEMLESEGTGYKLRDENPYRIPDIFVAAAVVGDVKNEAKLSLDEQMRDNVRIAQGDKVRLQGQTALLGPTNRFDLVVRAICDRYPKGTIVSGNLKRAVQNNGGQIYEVIDS